MLDIFSRQPAMKEAHTYITEGFDTDSYKEEMSSQATTEAKWYFINMQLQEKYDDIEITAVDIDAQLGMEAARYG